MARWRGDTVRGRVMTGAAVALVAAVVAWWGTADRGDVAVDAEPSPDTPRTSPTEAGPSEPTRDPATPTASPSATPSPTAPAEVRAVWVHLFDDTLKTPASVDRVVDRIADANANTLLVEVVRRQDAYYDSDVLPRTTDPQLADEFDVLGHVVERAHARGLVVHAWVPVLSAYHHAYDDLPRPEGWVWTEHGPDAPTADRWVTRLADRTWSDHLDPGVPAVRDHVAEVMAELAGAYPVDGVHLDYVRYTSEDAGYHPTALARYRAATGATRTPAVDDPAWTAWRRDQVTALVDQVGAAVDAADPDVAVSAAVIAQGDGPTADRPFDATRPVTRYHQDWAAWAVDGRLDALFPMVYLDQRTHAGEFDQWSGFLDRFADEVDPLLVGGQAAYLNAPERSLAQLDRLQAGADGVAVYSYQQTSDTGTSQELLDHLVAGPWQHTAPVPAPLRR